MTTKGPLFDALRTALRNNPDSRKAASQAFLDEMRRDTARYLTLLGLDYFYGNCDKLIVTDQGRDGVVVAPRPVKSREQTVKESKARVEKELQNLKQRLASVILMDMTMPNGKLLRHCTLGEVGKFGGFYTEIARHGKKTEVVDKRFSERELKALRDRFLSQPGRRAADAHHDLHVS